MSVGAIFSTSYGSNGSCWVVLAILFISWKKKCMRVTSKKKCMWVTKNRHMGHTFFHLRSKFQR